MYFLKSAFFSLLLAIATLFSLALAGDTFAYIQKDEPETLHLVTECFSGDLILPSTVTNSLVGYKTWAKAVESYKYSILECSWILKDINFYTFSDNIENYSLQIIYPFHTFW